MQPEKPDPVPTLAVIRGDIVRLPVPTRLPAGLTEAELLRGYAPPGMHPVEAFALGAVTAATMAMLSVAWGGAL